MKPLILSLLLTPLLQATPITGDYIFGGSFTLDSTKLTTATEIRSLTTYLLFSDGNVTPASTGYWEGPITLHYSPNVYVAGDLRFEMEDFHVDFLNPNFLNATGSGTAYAEGKDPTKMDLSMTGVWQNGFTYGSSQFHLTPTAVPEGGSTVALLGGALLLVGLGRRREGRGL